MLIIRKKAARFAVAQTIVLLFVGSVAFAQKKATNSGELSPIDVGIFQDDAGHWYGIADKDNMINARPHQPRYTPNQVEAIADNILLYQKDNGGWPKNYDMLAILTPGQKDTLLQGKHLVNTTFDNRTTYSHIATLSRVYAVIREDKYKQAALKGLDFILTSQYANGGWPQYYPLEDNYSRCITFNDDAFTGIMWVLKDIVENRPTYDFVDAKRRKLLETAYNKGLDCILKTQINDAGKPTAWCQQYDEKTLAPAWARKFEPPSICNGESVEIVSLLMSIKNPSAAVKAAVENAVAWFNESKITGIRVKTIPAPELVTPFRISHTDRVVVNDSTAPPIWTRYYELKTHRPLFCNRDSKVVYSLAEVARERRDGYGWYTYNPQRILDLYPVWEKQYK
ncbi:MAG TPA: pectate lyase [Chitinophagaceae bacterium]|jgi:PelA/Pel-15E family pectate lyase